MSWIQQRLGGSRPSPSASRSGEGRAREWRVPRFPMTPRGTVELHDLPGASLTRFRTGRLPSHGRPDVWVQGAAYDADGLLVPASQRWRGRGFDRIAACDPGRSAPERGAEVLEGTWLYAGHWTSPFGHFVTETLTTLWPTTEALGGVAGSGGLAGIVGHRWITSAREPLPWHGDLLEPAGLDALPVRLVGATPMRVERLLVPERPYVVGGWVHQEAVDVWRRVGRRLTRPGTPRRVYLSRTRFNAEVRGRGRPTRTTPERDAALDRDFAAAGFDVVHPETLPVTEQVALAAGAEVVAGAAGSALHLSAFATRPLKVIEVGDSRSPDKRVVGQRMIDRACGHLGVLVRHRESAAEVLDGLDLDPRAP